MKMLQKVSAALLALVLLLSMGAPLTAQAAAGVAQPKISGIALKSVTSAKVEWKKVRGAKGYVVYRAAGKSGKYKKVKTTAALAYTDKALTPGETYSYKVRAYQAQGGKKVYGKYSAPKAVKMKLGQPKVAKKSATQTSAALTWGKVAGASGYEVRRATSKGGTYKKLATAKTAAYTDKGLKAGKSYYYKVRAFGKAGGKTYYGGYSAALKVTTPKAAATPPKQEPAPEEPKTPQISFVARNPSVEYLYSDLGFFSGSRLNFDLVVTDAAGQSYIEIEEVASGNPDGGNYKEYKQTRKIPIDGPGTYHLFQEMRSGNRSSVYYNNFEYTVRACGKSYTVHYRGYKFDRYNGDWYQTFGIA